MGTIAVSGTFDRFLRFHVREPSHNLSTRIGSGETIEVSMQAIIFLTALAWAAFYSMPDNGLSSSGQLRSGAPKPGVEVCPPGYMPIRRGVCEWFQEMPGPLEAAPSPYDQYPPPGYDPLRPSNRNFYHDGL
ncbi:hypothetical protein ACMDCR_24270 [Labrys okinawensis]|uniref:hypothetical protein n=1 Tax=Labrys okinawensis TaxID=346911 RepID=UPI0039BCAA55